jgi:hypothetical protein
MPQKKKTTDWPHPSRAPVIHPLLDDSSMLRYHIHELRRQPARFDRRIAVGPLLRLTMTARGDDLGRGAKRRRRTRSCNRADTAPKEISFGVSGFEPAARKKKNAGIGTTKSIDRVTESWVEP